MRLSILDRILDNVPLSIVEHKRCKSLLQRIQGLVLRAKCFRIKVPPARQGENSGNCDPLYLLRLISPVRRTHCAAVRLSATMPL